MAQTSSIFYLGFDGSTPATALETSRQHALAFAGRLLRAAQLGFQVSQHSEVRQLLEKEGRWLWNFALLLACWRLRQEPGVRDQIEALTRDLSARLKPFFSALDRLSNLLSRFVEKAYKAQTDGDLEWAGKALIKMLLLLGRLGPTILSLLLESEDYQVITAQLDSRFTRSEFDEERAAKHLRSSGWSEPHVQKILNSRNEPDGSRRDESR